MSRIEACPKGNTRAERLYKGTRLPSLDLWRGIWEISFCVLTYDDFSRQNKGTEITPRYKLLQLIRIQQGFFLRWFVLRHSLLPRLSSRTKHYRPLVHHCRNSNVLSLLSALLALFRCACVSFFSISVQFKLIVIFPPTTSIKKEREKKKNSEHFTLHSRLIFYTLLIVHLHIFSFILTNMMHSIFLMSLFHASTCFEHKRSSSGGQNCTIQSLVSSHLQVAVPCTGCDRNRCDDTRDCIVQFWHPEDEHSEPRPGPFQQNEK